MNPADKAYEQGRAAVAAQKNREEQDMGIVIGEGGQPTRAQKVVLDLTGTPVKDLEIIQKALEEALADGAIGGRKEALSGLDAYALGKEDAAKEFETERADLQTRIAELEGKAAEAEKARDDLASEAGGKSKAVKDAEGILLGQEDIIKSLRAEVETLQQALAKFQGEAVQGPPAPEPEEPEDEEDDDDKKTTHKKGSIRKK